MEQYTGLPATNSPIRVEPPPHLVGVKAVPNMVAGKDGSLAASGKVEVRFTNPFVRGRDKKVDWQRTAYLAGHEALYAYQYARDQDIRIGELERHYSTARANYDAAMTENRAHRQMIREFNKLSIWPLRWLLPKRVRKTLALSAVVA